MFGDRRRKLMARKWSFGAAAVMINGAGDEFLAGAAFARDEHSCVRLRDLADEFEDLLHRLAIADNTFGVIFTREQWLVAHDLAHVAGDHSEADSDDLELFGTSSGFEDVIVRAEFHGLDSSRRSPVKSVHRSPTGSLGSSSRRGGKVSRPLGAPMRISISTRLERSLRDHQNRFLAVARIEDLQGFAGEVAMEGASNIRLVVDNQNLIHGAAS